MSAVLPNIDGWVGYGDGKDALLRSDEAWDSDHELVRERPELFESVEPPAPVKRMAVKKAAKADG